MFSVGDQTEYTLYIYSIIWSCSKPMVQWKGNNHTIKARTFGNYLYLVSAGSKDAKQISATKRDECTKSVKNRNKSPSKQRL